jgi:L-aspartate oxidase
MPAVVLSAGKLGGPSSSGWAQGGIAAAVGSDDAPNFHAEDTIKAGAGLCDPAIVRLVTEGAPAVIEKLIARGVVFDRDANGKLQLGLEGAHSRRRIVHAGGDGAGRAVMDVMIEVARATPSIEIIEHAMATDLLTDDNGIRGVVFMRDGKRATLDANRVVLATGGAGALWYHTTNPPGAQGQGLALAARAGAAFADLEFVQFHPTAIDIGRDPMPLASEALRGEGAVLIDDKGARFMAHFPRAELEPRDVVSRAIHAHMNKGHRVFLDARIIDEKFAARFPAIHAACAVAGIDPARTPIPVRPAAHYHMGGVAVDAWGRSSVAGLWACGEAACTGLHGANRLASNSLLEAAFFGERVAQDICSRQEWPNAAHGKIDVISQASIISPNIRNIMSTHVGVLRNEAGLQSAVQQLLPLAEHSDAALVALMIAASALMREESRGSHARTDFPAASPAQRRILSLDDIRAYAQNLEEPALAMAGA